MDDRQSKEKRSRDNNTIFKTPLSEFRKVRLYLDCRSCSKRWDREKCPHRSSVKWIRKRTIPHSWSSSFWQESYSSRKTSRNLSKSKWQRFCSRKKQNYLKKDMKSCKKCTSECVGQLSVTTLTRRWDSIGGSLGRNRSFKKARNK